MLTEKACTKCKKVLPATSFQRRPEVRSGLASWCRKCVNARINGVTNPRMRRKRKEQIIQLKGGACAACGGIFPSYVYDLHHRDPATKEVNMNKIANMRWERVMAELPKCDLLCANCHRIAHHSARYQAGGLTP